MSIRRTIATGTCRKPKTSIPSRPETAFPFTHGSRQPMGITIHYRGRLADGSRLEALEDLVIDLVLELGGAVDVWRSVASDDPSRMVRGLLVNLEPGQETFSLLFSPEGWLTPLIDIEAAERGQLQEAPWCFVKTQFGSPVGHAALVEVLSVLRDRFLPELEVHDETDYWQHRDPVKMAELMERNARAIEAFASAIEATSLTDEARESPEIIAARIERIAHIVHAQLQAGSQPTDNSLRDDDAGEEFGKPWPEIEYEWQKLVHESQARARRIERTVQEHLLAGEDIERALEAADAAEFPSTDRPQHEEGDFAPVENQSSIEEGEAWQFEEEDLFDLERPERDPLLERATQLYLALGRMADEFDSAQVADLLRHAGELCGGLAQALPLPPAYECDPDERGLAAVQLKRALRGAAFLRGGLLHLAHAAADGGQPYRELRQQVEALQSEIVECLRQTRPMPGA